MQIVGTARQGFAPEPFLALVGHAVAVGVRQFPDARRRRDVQRPVEPHRAFRQHHLVGEDHAAVEAPVAVRILEAHDPMRPVGELPLHPVVRSRGICDIQPAEVVEVGDDRTVDEGRTRHTLDLEPGWHGETRAGIGLQRLRRRAWTGEAGEDGGGDHPTGTRRVRNRPGHDLRQRRRRG